MAANEETKRDVSAGITDRAQTTLTAATADAPAGGSGATAGAYDSAANRNIAIAKINRNGTRIDEIEVALQRLGLLA